MHKTKDLYLTNRFYLAVHVYSGNAQVTSKRGKNICHATHLRLVVYFFVLTTSRRPLCVVRVYTHRQIASICLYIVLISVIPHKIRHVFKTLRSDDLRAQYFNHKLY